MARALVHDPKTGRVACATASSQSYIKSQRVCLSRATGNRSDLFGVLTRTSQEGTPTSARDCP
jgi:hypothetical protein